MIFNCGDRCEFISSHLPLLKVKVSKLCGSLIVHVKCSEFSTLAYHKCILALILWICIAFDREKNVSGAAVTPYVLKRVNELTGGASLAASILFLDIFFQKVANMVPGVFNDSMSLNLLFCCGYS